MTIECHHRSETALAHLGTMINYGIEIDIPAGNALSITPPSGVLAQNRSIVIEQLTISGGSGNGFLRLGYDVHGVTYLSNFQFTSALASLLIDSIVDAHSTLIVDSSADGSVSGFGSFLDIPFAYNAPFGISGVFEIDLLRPGSMGGRGPLQFGPFSASADFLADFTCTVFDEQLRPVSSSIITSNSGLFCPQPLAAVAVPEPSSAALFASGLLGLGLLYRRRRPAKV